MYDIFTWRGQEWLDNEKRDGSTVEQALDAWKEMERQALAGENPQPWDGFVMLCSTASTGGKSLQVRAPSQKNKTGDVRFPQALPPTQWAAMEI